MWGEKRGAGHRQHAPVNPVTGMPNECDAAADRTYDEVESPLVDSATSADADRAFTTSNGSIDEVVERLRSLLDSRLLSIVVLVLLSFAVIARESFVAFLIVLVVGYMLTDRFLTVRRAVTLGGSAWFIVIFLGDLLTARVRPLFVDIDYLFMFCGFLLALAVCGVFFAGRALYYVGYDRGQAVADRVRPLFVDIDYLFMFCGFLLALAVCGVFFAGRALYYVGYDRGQAVADRVIADHLVDRMIEHPQDVDNLDGTYLEVEGAISRVRDRERQVADALRDEARRKDDLVTYLAHDLKTPLASVVGYLSLLQEAPDLPVEQRLRFTGIALDKAHRLDALIEEFFDITRFDFHDIVLTRGYVDLSLLLAQVADEFYPALAEQGKHVEVDAPLNLTVLVDGDKMARVFNNVMKNAIAYSYEGSAIRERQVADALRDEARRKDDLVTYLAHDLKTPLASVVGYLSLLQEAPDLPVEQRLRFTGIALDKAHRLDALIEEFFDITRFDFHDIVLTRGYVDLSLLLAQVADEFYPALAEQGKHVEVDAPLNLTVLVDGDKMARVFNNVMKNAIAYSYEGSAIRIRASRTDESVTVCFENQGDPIPAAKLATIFEKFYRLDAARATNRGGAGLGLAIAKEIVTAHGGSISCESTPERTVFTIVLPA